MKSAYAGRAGLDVGSFARAKKLSMTTAQWVAARANIA
jgi:hypothetical protein